MLLFKLVSDYITKVGLQLKSRWQGLQVFGKVGNGFHKMLCQSVTFEWVVRILDWLLWGNIICHQAFRIDPRTSDAESLYKKYKKKS